MTTTTTMTRGLAREADEHQYRFDGPTYLSLAARQRREWLTPEEHAVVLELAIFKVVNA